MLHLNQITELRHALKQRAIVTEYFDIFAEGSLDKFETLSEKQYRFLMVIMDKRQHYKDLHEILDRIKIKRICKNTQEAGNTISQ